MYAVRSIRNFKSSAVLAAAPGARKPSTGATSAVGNSALRQPRRHPKPNFQPRICSPPPKSNAAGSNSVVVGNGDFREGRASPPVRRSKAPLALTNSLTQPLRIRPRQHRPRILNQIAKRFQRRQRPRRNQRPLHALRRSRPTTTAPTPAPPARSRPASSSQFRAPEY